MTSPPPLEALRKEHKRLAKQARRIDPRSSLGRFLAGQIAAFAAAIALLKGKP